eukprot:GEMP01018452.1.p1 GENE.GEMP01018452.1~~GEMP01018452.1.p1  ORF type:complete len:335 (+),score=60.66 GEMP01018452.1:127-1131(+)
MISFLPLFFLPCVQATTTWNLNDYEDLWYVSAGNPLEDFTMKFRVAIYLYLENATNGNEAHMIVRSLISKIKEQSIQEVYVGGVILCGEQENDILNKVTDVKRKAVIQPSTADCTAVGYKDSAGGIAIRGKPKFFVGGCNDQWTDLNNYDNWSKIDEFANSILTQARVHASNKCEPIPDDITFPPRIRKCASSLECPEADRPICSATLQVCGCDSDKHCEGTANDSCDVATRTCVVPACIPANPVTRKCLYGSKICHVGMVFANNTCKEKPSDNRWWIYLIIAIVVLLVLGVVGVIVYYWNKKKQEDAEKKQKEEQQRQRKGVEEHQPDFDDTL